MRFLLLVFLFCSAFLIAQKPDSTRLPFAISDEKKLSEEDLQNKKEGTYVTGVPDLSSDPVNGFGYGGEGSLFFNGKRSDPFFEYTAYRARIDLALFNTTKQQREAMITLDVPYIFNTKWRLRVEGGFEINPNLLYFGNTENSLAPLSYYPNNDSTRAPVVNAMYSDYADNISANNAFYNTYIKEEYVLNISGERSYFDGKLRILAGYEIAHVNINTFSGRSMLQEDFSRKKILGVGSSLVTIAQAGLIFDTRDLETDPSKGIFSELTNELSLNALGSQYNFNKTFFHFNFYGNLIPQKVKKFVVAARVAFGYTAGDAPFFEYQDEWSSEGSIEGLGGAHTLRGYKQSRFLGRVMTFNNLELRYRFAQFNLWKQHFALAAVPFADAGSVWNEMYRIQHLENFRFSEGLGLRIVWNVNTVLRFDYAFSKEDRQFFFNLSHAF